MNKLVQVQAALKAPKGQFNKFGGYSYRSCEDILEAVKPLLAEHGLQLTLSDEVLMVGDWHYVKATATVADGAETVTTTGYAREVKEKKGMDGSQITGTASSYARKYALNALFLIDDSKDADATNTHGKQPKAATRTVPAQPKPDPLQQAKARLWAAVQAYAEGHGGDAKALAAGVQERPDADMSSAEWLNQVAYEFEVA